MSVSMLVDKSGYLPADDKRQTAKETEHYPRKAGDGEAFARVDAALARFDKTEDPACSGSNKYCYQECTYRSLLMINEPHYSGDNKQARLYQHYLSYCM